MRGRESKGVGCEEEEDQMINMRWRRRGRRSSGGGGGDGGPCGACKFLRRKCMRGCVFAPYFGADEEGREGFSAVHKVFGASNVSKLLQRIPHPDQRRHALITLQYQAHARLLDPIYGCLRTIFALKRQVENLQAELECVRAEVCSQQLLLTRDRVKHVECATTIMSERDGLSPEVIMNSSCIDQVVKEDGGCNMMDFHVSFNYKSSISGALDTSSSKQIVPHDQFFEHSPFLEALPSEADSIQRFNLLDFLAAQDFHELH